MKIEKLIHILQQYILQQQVQWWMIMIAALVATVCMFAVRETTCWFYKTNRLLRKLDKVLAVLEEQEERVHWRKKHADDDFSEIIDTKTIR